MKYPSFCACSLPRSRRRFIVLYSRRDTNKPNSKNYSSNSWAPARAETLLLEILFVPPSPAGVVRRGSAGVSYQTVSRGLGAQARRIGRQYIVPSPQPSASVAFAAARLCSPLILFRGICAFRLCGFPFSRPCRGAWFRVCLVCFPIPLLRLCGICAGTLRMPSIIHSFLVT